MQLAPKASLKSFTLLILVHFFLSSISESHILLVIASLQFNRKTMNNLRSHEPWASRIWALIRCELHLQTRWSARTNIISDAPSCQTCSRWWRCGSALQVVGSFPWLPLRAAPSGLLAGMVTGTQLPWRIWRRGLPLRLRIMATLLPPLPSGLHHLTRTKLYHA